MDIIISTTVAVTVAFLIIAGICTVYQVRKSTKNNNEITKSKKGMNLNNWI